MERQFGWYTLCPQVLMEHAHVLDQLCRQAHLPSLLEQLVVPASAKRTLLEKLALSSVTEESLFPGLDGLGRHIKMVMKLLSRDE